MPESWSPRPRSFQVSVGADCDPTHVEDLEAVGSEGVEVRVEYDEGLILVQATAAPTSVQPAASGHSPSPSEAVR
ncbi:hypothetical protein [Rhodococcus sp. NPDC060176]|uniref:hypothetical protein n=1 Tax=Rhodococcus sp. NPDC060176 TaxID=3347062 RepID=UPI00364D8628